MKDGLNNLLNAAANSIQNASQNAAERIAARRALANAEPMSPEVARIDQETKLAQTKMVMSMAKKLLVAFAIFTILTIGGIIAFGVYSMNKVDGMHAKRMHQNEKMMDNAIDRLKYGL